jgi:hypothetical protein
MLDEREGMARIGSESRDVRDVERGHIDELIIEKHASLNPE